MDKGEYMRVVVQRVLSASLKVDNKLISEIGKGLVVFLGIGEGDNEENLQKLMQKIAKLRIFEDENGKMNLSVNQVKGEVLLVSQFTLYGDCSHGNRPSFIKAEKPERAKMLYEMAKTELSNEGLKVKTGVFGADMKIDVLNDGPVTIILDSRDLK